MAERVEGSAYRTPGTSTIERSPCANISLSFLFPACSEENKKNYQIFINKKACRLFDPSVAIAQTPRPPKPHKQPRKKSPKHTVNYITTPVNLAQLQLAPKTLRIIKTGDANQYDKDRSKAYFIVLQELINKGLDDNQIANIVLYSEYDISERFLEKGIDWSLQEINRVRSKSKQRGLLSKIPTCYNHQEYMSASGAVDYLSRVLKFCVNKPKGIKGIKAPAGLGKTASLIRAIVKSNLLYVEFYVPNHRLAEECRLRFIKAGLNTDQVQTIKGRTFKAEGQSPLCKRHTVVDKLGEHNIGTYNSLCRNQESTCEYFDSCSFLAQFKLRTRVRIFVHKHLALERGLLDHRLPDLAVIDESFWQELITIKTISRESITRFIQPEALQKAILTAFDSKIPLLKRKRPTEPPIRARQNMI